MDYLVFCVVIAPAIIGLIAALALGPNRGIIIGAIVMLVAVIVLLFFQVTPHEFGSAMGLMRFEWYRWAPAFLVGAAIGSVIFRTRRGG
ncbi:hypothetical protein [Mesorhizobium retamae]|uniref:Uncharacterized protein n=1 Tax=Mesorhizobium retamae TaxID=2912854 RepID=A0ABS9QG92_9HYPH|nr:hypothetical protein [Mesorhizobium sp. IRAMC:0171]MCG7505634.1 hypothetical protein [Mesorhizobium sp. IRAMC:0171]